MKKPKKQPDKEVIENLMDDLESVIEPGVDAVALPGYRMRMAAIDNAGAVIMEEAGSTKIVGSVLGTGAISGAIPGKSIASSTDIEWPNIAADANQGLRSEELESRSLDLVVSWATRSADISWTDSSNWACNDFPDIKDQVVITNNLYYDFYYVTSTDAVCHVSDGSPEKTGPRQEPENDRGKLLDALFAGLPDDPKSRMDAVVRLQQVFRKRAARELQPSIDIILHNPPGTFSEKQALASEINHIFQELGIAACEHGSTQPCSIVAHRSQSSMESGWLKLQTKKPPQSRSKPTTKLEKIELIEAIREEGFGRIR